MRKSADNNSTDASEDLATGPCLLPSDHALGKRGLGSPFADLHYPDRCQLRNAARDSRPDAARAASQCAGPSIQRSAGLVSGSRDLNPFSIPL